MANRVSDAANHPLGKLSKIDSIALGQLIRALEVAVENHTKAVAAGCSDLAALTHGNIRKQARVKLVRAIAKLVSECNA